MTRAVKRSVTSSGRHPRDLDEGGCTPMPSRRGRTARRGFTLIELLITCAMVGVLAALGLVGYRKFIQSSQSSEAKAVISMIRGGEEAYKAEMLVYLSPSASLGDYYPNATPNDSRMNFSQPGDPRYTDPVKGWALLNITTDAPVRFGYAVVAGIGNPMTAPTMLTVPPAMPLLPAGVPWYTVQAINDHDNNGIFAVFCTSSVSGEILSQNEQE
jgi:type IV pilus assembly protein PilA